MIIAIDGGGGFSAWRYYPLLAGEAGLANDDLAGKSAARYFQTHPTLESVTPVTYIPIDFVYHIDRSTEEEIEMALNKFCPGSTAIKNPIPEYIECPWCKAEVEIWSDEIKTTCPSCKATVFKDRLPSCVDWCTHAEECVGTKAYRRLKGK